MKNNTTSLWINAGKLLANDPTLQVLCPECKIHYLVVQDVRSEEDTTVMERQLICRFCGAHNYLRMIRPQSVYQFITTIPSR